MTAEFSMGGYDDGQLKELFDLARFAPNHHLTQPWRFRVLGPEALARLKEAAGPVEAPKLDRAPTLAGSPPTGGRRPSCARARVARRSASRSASAFSA